MEAREFFGNISNIFKKIAPTELDEFEQYHDKAKKFDEAIERGADTGAKQMLTKISQSNHEPITPDSNAGSAPVNNPTPEYLPE